MSHLINKKTGRAAKKRVAAEAKKFRVWQYCNAVGWDCTVKEIAESLDLRYENTHKLIEKAGWMPLIDDAKREGIRERSHRAVAVRERHTNSHLVDVCDLMERNTL